MAELRASLVFIQYYVGKNAKKSGIYNNIIEGKIM